MYQNSLNVQYIIRNQNTENIALKNYIGSNCLNNINKFQ